MRSSSSGRPLVQALPNPFLQSCIFFLQFECELCERLLLLFQQFTIKKACLKSVLSNICLQGWWLVKLVTAVSDSVDMGLSAKVASAVSCEDRPCVTLLIHGSETV